MPEESEAAYAQAAYARVVSRITRAMLAIGAAGSVALGARQGWRFGLGFLLGAGLSYLSFWRWQKVVESLGETPGRQRAMGMVVRFGLLAAGAYGIIKYLEVNPVAVLFGLLVAAAAVLVSLVLELIYGT